MKGGKKYIIVHGVQLTSLQEMLFSKWINNNNIAMNTLTSEQRTAKVTKFINEVLHRLI